MDFMTPLEEDKNESILHDDTIIDIISDGENS